MTYLFQLGREQHLALAEIAAVAAASHSSYDLQWRYGDCACIETNLSESALKNLAGMIKIAKVLCETDQSSLEKIISDDLISAVSHGKITFGISWYVQESPLPNALPSRIKKILSEHERVSRFVTAKEGVLNAAAVLHNDLIAKGAEYIVVTHGKKYAVGRTIFVQDIEGWGTRDFEKPARDNNRGMLPPKLARIMVHLAGSQPDATILDPFCGVGTVAMEGALLGYAMIASDADPAAFQATQKNIAWLGEHYSITHPPQILQADAREISKRIKEKVSAIVTEPLLGNEKKVTIAQRKEEIKKLLELYTKSLVNWKKILAPNATVVMVIPFFTYRDETLQIRLEEMLAGCGYAMKEGPYRYMREGQRVGREIFVLQTTSRS